MSNVIPFHCLVFCDNHQLDLFPSHERISYRRIAHDLVGHDAPDLTAIIGAEARHRVGLKLSLGQRVAVAAADFPRPSLHDAAYAQGAQVRTIVGSPMPPLAVSLSSDPYDHLQAHWRGITVVGDVHGDLRAMTRALRWAQTRQNYVWLLGDVVDYGADTLATADAAYAAVMAGEAGIIIGNHERKIARWLDQGNHGLRITEGNRVTIDALNALKKVARQQWVGRFRSLLAHASLMQQIGNVTLLHAAAHPSLWTEKPNTPVIEQFALYGESDHSTGKFRRVHRWIDMVPAGKMVFIGHDTIGPFPTIVSGALGGQVVFLDTGGGTGGYLSSADLRFGDRGLHLECFNRH